MQWHLYGRVVDNFGDIGFAWRLAADLASRGEHVRLALDDASALAWMAPAGSEGVEIAGWDDAAATTRADVVVELFGGGLPKAVAEWIAVAARPPVCIDVEHLSAEGYVERSHGLPSPRPAAGGRSTTTWFFFPGFTSRTGGLLRETSPAAASAAADPLATLATLGIDGRGNEMRASLFCYANPAIDALLDALAAMPTLLMLTPGFATDQVAARLGPSMRRGELRAIGLPLMPQTGYDRLLAACDLNFVRGEDSLVGAIGAGRPFVWQLYPQGDGAHAAKLDAFLGRFIAGAAPDLAGPVRSAFAGWNGSPATAPWADLLAPAMLGHWREHCTAWREALSAQADLTTQLINFAVSKR